MNEKNAKAMLPFRIPRRALAVYLILTLALRMGPAQPAPAPAAGAAGAAVAHAELWPSARSRGLIRAADEQRITALLAHLSLEEKIGQMIQADMSTIRPEDLREVPVGSVLAGGNSPSLGSAVLRTPLADWVATTRAFRRASLEERSGHTPIPVMLGIDAVHGNSHVPGATVFPHNVGLGATHDPGLLQRIAAATAQETAASGFDWAFGPTLAVPQDVRWGRSYEGYSDDPDLVTQYAGPFVRGLQGDPADGPGAPAGLLQGGHVAASAKHFLGDGGTHDGIDQGDAQVSEAELIRLHAPAYRAAIDAGALTVMASFSSWQGVKMSGNRSLLTDVLKGRMGFDGFVVSDWNSHGQLPGCSNVNCPAAVNAGIDMLMAPDGWKELYRNLLAQARAGVISAERIDDAVRRILRVKLRLGLFAAERPWEGREDVLGSPEHRALAREAVRKSLVLLKNRNGVLPLRASAHVLVAGSGADSIGTQCGGWTLSWQGNDNHNGDFPRGTSIYAGLSEALRAGGGSAQLQIEGHYTQRPDIAVVVFGETPYAEGWGDLKNLEYQAGDKHDLALLRRLKSLGVPVVSIFLSGRPLWVNPEINASDAFVAAWLPGTEGAGIADVLVGDAAGRPRNDFTGRLSFAWPATAAHVPPGTPGAAPQYADGYGLHFGIADSAPRLAEVSGVSAAESNFANYLVHGRTRAPWSWQLRGAPGSAAAVTRRAVDAEGLQEGGLELRWSGNSVGTAALAGPAFDMRMLSNGEAALAITLRIEDRPDAPVRLAVGCGPECQGAIDFTPVLAQGTPGQWRTIKVKLSCFREAGADVGRVAEPFSLRTAGHLRLTVTTIQLSSDPAGAICPLH
jgi:beta-glucosidase